MPKVETVLMYDAPDLVQRITVTGWVDRTGRFWGDDEHMARFCSASHTRCECGSVIPINSLICAACIKRREIEAYAKMPRARWDGEGMLYSQATNRFYSSLDEAQDDADHFDGGVLLSDLRLVICVAVPYSTVSDEHWRDDMPPDDQELPDDIGTALDALNEVISKARPASWVPGDTALFLEPPHAPERVA